MSDWNPALYSRYEDERIRPAQDLLARVPLIEVARAARVFDPGCVARRFIEAQKA